MLITPPTVNFGQERFRKNKMLSYWYYWMTGSFPKKIRCLHPRQSQTEAGYPLFEMIGHDDKRYLIWSLEDTLRIRTPISGTPYSEEDGGFILA